MAKYLIDSTDIEIEEVSGTENLKLNLASGNSAEQMIGDLSNLSTTNKLNVVNAINEVNTNLTNLNTYSTTETVIGKWINGKTLYRRVLNVTSPSVLNTYTSISNLSSAGIDTMLPLKGTLYAADGRELSINHPEPSYTICTTFLSGSIEMKIESNLWESRPCMIIIEYTKN